MNVTRVVPVAKAKHMQALASFPDYQRENLCCGIAHLGLGNFHRSHQALYLHKLLQKKPQNWMIHAIGMRSGSIPLINAMRSQDNLYTLTERSGTEDTIQVIGAIKEVSHGPSETESVIDTLSQKTIKIISMTVTEKGYCNTPTGDLDTEDKLIKQDLLRGALPVTMLGYLFAIAEKRMSNAGEPFTVMSCDNLPGNGTFTQRLLLQFTELKNPKVARWIHENVSFPNSMVDRITPATTDALQPFIAKKFGIIDNCPVMSEAFIQWVLEDKFIAGRPELEKVGVQFVPSVKPYEVLKTRMLNGAHSALSYVSYLMNYRNVDVAMRDPLIYEYLKCYMDEDITPTIPDLPGIDIEEYKVTLRKRFSNPAVSDQIQRIAMDGSTKIKMFIVPPLAQKLNEGGSIRWMVFALAAWCKYLSGVDEAGHTIEIIDPLQDELVGHVPDASSLLSKHEIFGSEVAKNKRLLTELDTLLRSINNIGTKKTLQKLLA
jgi:mannitol-1-phosphate/altronate dehydrogenase